MNDTYFNTAQDNTPAWRNLVVCQEVGHTFGLDHQDENFSNPNLGTCMDYTNNPATNQHPNAHDYEELETIDAHFDSTTTVGAAVAPSPQSSGVNLDDPLRVGSAAQVEPRRSRPEVRARPRQRAEGLHVRHLGPARSGVARTARLDAGTSAIVKTDGWISASGSARRANGERVDDQRRIGRRDRRCPLTCSAVAPIDTGRLAADLHLATRIEAVAGAGTPDRP